MPVPARSKPTTPANINLVEQTKEFLNASKSDATRKAYRTAWSEFTEFCSARRQPSLPASPETVALFISYLASERLQRYATINKKVSAISQRHQAAGHEAPTRSVGVRSVLAGVRRTIGVAQEGKKPILTPELRAMVEQLPENLIGLRDRALLLLGFAGAFRRSEITDRLDLADIEMTAEGLVVTIQRSKTDQDGEGRKVGIPYGSRLSTCPVRSMQAWLMAANITEGAVFRSIDRHGRVKGRLPAYAVADIVKRSMARLDKDTAGVAAHSLRSGLCTQAALLGCSERSIANVTGHRSMTVLRRYIRAGSVFKDNANALVGL